MAEVVKGRDGLLRVLFALLVGGVLGHFATSPPPWAAQYLPWAEPAAWTGDERVEFLLRVDKVTMAMSYGLLMLPAATPETNRSDYADDALEELRKLKLWVSDHEPMPEAATQLLSDLSSAVGYLEKAETAEVGNDDDPLRRPMTTSGLASMSQHNLDQLPRTRSYLLASSP